MLTWIVRPFRTTETWRVACAVACAAAAAAFSLWATLPNLHWYGSLQRPSFRLPPWIFGPLWCSTYAMMGWALLRLLRSPDWMPDRGPAMRAFAVQLVLLAVWPIAFFGLHRPKLGLIAIMAGVLAAANAIRLSRRVDPAAGRILLPSLAWAIFVLLLNLSIAIRN